MSEENKSLQILDKARIMLAECRTIQDTKKIMTLADAGMFWAKKLKLSEDAREHCQAIRNEAELKMGEMLIASKAQMAKGGQPFQKKPTGAKSEPVEQPTLASMGISKKESARAQKLVAVVAKHSDTKDAVMSGKITASEAVKHVHVGQNSGENEWYTPAIFIEAARSVMGSIDCDPASSAIANKTVRAHIFYTKDDDGLTKKWGEKVWINPPYAQPLISEFCDALVHKFNTKEVRESCVLVNNATETQWFQKLLMICGSVCFLKSRVKFLDPQGNLGAPLQGQAVIYCGKNIGKFQKHFESLGQVLNK